MFFQKKTLLAKFALVLQHKCHLLIIQPIFFFWPEISVTGKFKYQNQFFCLLIVPPTGSDQSPAKTSVSPRSSPLGTFRPKRPSLAAKNVEKRMFSQAKWPRTFPQDSTHAHKWLARLPNLGFCLNLYSFRRMNYALLKFLKCKYIW